MLGPFQVAVDSIPLERRNCRAGSQGCWLCFWPSDFTINTIAEQLIEMLWPDLDPESAVNNLPTTIHMVRHALEPALKSAADSHFLLTQGQQILLRAPKRLWIDVEAFEQHAAKAIKSGNPAAFETALSFYKGDLLVEDLYEDWATVRREQLRTTRHDLLVKLVQLYEVRGEYDRSIERLKELVALDPRMRSPGVIVVRVTAASARRSQFQNA